MISPKSVGVKIYSITGALVADYYNNTNTNDGLVLFLKVSKVGGLDLFRITLANNVLDPLFTDMICKFYVDGVHWFSGFAETLPEVDSATAALEVEGKGYVHKLKTIIVNESYTAQTLDYIVKDIASKYLSADLQVLYDVAKIATPTVSSVDVEFKDKRLDEVFNSLLSVCNADYETAQYRYYVDKDQYLNFVLISQDAAGAFFEGFDYQSPGVNTLSSHLVNTIMAYRTTVADPKAVEYVGTYSDVDSVSNYGEKAEKLTFPDYLNTAGIQRISESLIEEYKDPLTKITVEDLEVSAPLDFAFYKITNKRQLFYRDAANFEDLTDWALGNLSHTTATISSSQVFTNRTSLKLVTAVNALGDYMDKSFPVPIYFPTYFKFYAYLETAAAAFTITLYDTFGNTISISVGQNNEPLGEWLKFMVPIKIIYGDGLLWVDKDAANGGLLHVDIDATTGGNLKLLKILHDGILNLSSIRIEMDTDVASTFYLDQFSIEASAYKQHKLLLEEVEYKLDKSHLAGLTLGASGDSLIDEINKETAAGRAALEVFSKQ